MHGLHLTADLRGCDPALAPMRDAQALRALCVAAVAEAGLGAVAELFHRFAPAPGQEQSGVTGVVLLAESHLAIHTWPELGGVTLDVYVCNMGADNSARAEALMARLVEAFAPAGEVSRQAWRRGAPPSAPGR
ncbi:adenosylmethionine decarboxylase [Roseateles sp. DAIF2]|uniref:adenosylmethionine decarboxylase n=1 Tax=Roseateles sp. DAIF2 TaxID=2714952 RepID=UPI0018A263E8|nr:adenosylmethionine decarboxylase [Roseateles sp. DAIF2]QPF74593.1 adenosylmethionine decarboxylase [Roseateles sp. DAIF2]